MAIFKIKIIFLLTFMPVSSMLGENPRGFGSNTTYTLPYDLIGQSVYSYRTSGRGLFVEFKASAGIAHRDERFFNASGGMLKLLRPNLHVYLGGGLSWRIYAITPGSIQQKVEQGRPNLTGGVIIFPRGSSLIGKYLACQAGFELRPLCVSLGIGLHFDSPFSGVFKRSSSN